MAGPRQGLSLTDLDGDDDVLYGGGGDDYKLSGGSGEDVLYGGDGDDLIDATEQPFKDMHRDKLYCGEGEDHYIADKLDYVDSSCEVKNPPSNI
jgi:Ca2+-binding RTX toxin-like protein